MKKKEKLYYFGNKNKIFFWNALMLTKIIFVMITYWVSSMNKNQNWVISLRMFIHNIDFQYPFVWNYQIKILIFYEIFLYERKSFVSI